MMILAERTFTPADQKNFAALSGDFNPIHVDEVAARRTIVGAPVVHGVHLVCWALDSWVAAGNRTCAALGHVTSSFHRGVLVGEVVRTCLLNDKDEFTLQIQRADGSQMMSIRGKPGSPVLYPETLPPIHPTECRVLGAGEIDHAMGSLPLAYCATEAKRLFPHLSATMPPIQLAALFATTRLVGMECPGVHSLYAGLDLSFSEPISGKPQLNYRVTRADRSGAVILSVDGPGFQGKVRALMRPAPSRQAAAQQLRRLVDKDVFSDQRAIVIGGSRGLGEVTAKLLAMGGADVTITYHRGKGDAEAVAAEITAAGGRCGVAQFDSKHPTPIPLALPPTSVYYFATPHISSDNPIPFSTERFAEYCLYYAIGFAQTLCAVATHAQTMGVFYPSTAFLDDSPAGMAEYCAAKALGEEACKQLAKHFPTWYFYAPRLPRMPTDQNNGILPPEMEAGEIVMLRHLLRMKASCPPTAGAVGEKSPMEKRELAIDI